MNRHQEPVPEAQLWAGSAEDRGLLTDQEHSQQRQQHQIDHRLGQQPDHRGSTGPAGPAAAAAGSAQPSFMSQAIPGLDPARSAITTTSTTEATLYLNSPATGGPRRGSGPAAAAAAEDPQHALVSSVLSRNLYQAPFLLLLVCKTFLHYLFPLILLALVLQAVSYGQTQVLTQIRLKSRCHVTRLGVSVAYHATIVVVLMVAMYVYNHEKLWCRLALLTPRPGVDGEPDEKSFVQTAVTVSMTDLALVAVLSMVKAIICLAVQSPVRVKTNAVCLPSRRRSRRHRALGGTDDVELGLLARNDDGSSHSNGSGSGEGGNNSNSTSIGSEASAVAAALSSSSSSPWAQASAVPSMFLDIVRRRGISEAVGLVSGFPSTANATSSTSSSSTTAAAGRGSGHGHGNGGPHSHHSSDSMPVESLEESSNFLLTMRLVTAADAVGLVYRAMASAPMWLAYYYSGVGGRLFASSYFLFKIFQVSHRVRNAVYVINMLVAGTLEYGHYSTDVELRAARQCECPICFDPPQRPVTLDCRHIFCEVCVLEWLDKEKTCPVCRNEVACENTAVESVKAMVSDWTPLVV